MATLALAAPVDHPTPGDTGPMPERFLRRPRDDDDDQAIAESAGPAERNAVKLDRIKDDVGDMRVAMTSLAGDVKAMLGRIERHDADHLQGQVEGASTAADVERRLRSLERRSYAIPSLAAVLAVAGFLLALWTALQSGHL